MPAEMDQAKVKTRHSASNAASGSFKNDGSLRVF